MPMTTTARYAKAPVRLGDSSMADAWQFLLGGLVVGSIYGLIGVGFTCIYNVTGIVNFAQGDFAMVGAMSAIAIQSAGVPIWLSIILAILITCVVAAVIERAAVRPVRGDVMRGIIVTIGVGVVLQGLAAIIWGTDAQPMPAFSGEKLIHVFGATLMPQSLWVLGTTVIVMVGLALLFRCTYLGQMFRACSMNPFAARLVGMKVETMSLVGFLMSGALGALAGIVVAPIALTQYDTGLQLGIKGFVACIV